MPKTMTYILIGGAAFLLADRFAKSLPPTAAWALGWGSIATLGTLTIGGMITKNDAVATRSMVAATGIASAYLHAYSHQTPFPKSTGLVVSK